MSAPAPGGPLLVDAPLDRRGVAAVAHRRRLVSADVARARVEQASRIGRAIVKTGVRAYGVVTGVGALADTVVDGPRQRQISRNLLMSHAAGVGTPLGPPSDALLDNAETILGIELVAASEPHGHLGRPRDTAPGTVAVRATARGRVAPYRDDRPIADIPALGRACLHDGLIPWEAQRR